jgi:hypothetical protein
MVDTFSRLISPVDPQTFFEQYWSSAYLFLSRREYRPDDWLTVADIDLFFQSGHLPAASCNVISGGKPVPIEDWSREKTSDRGRYIAVDTERLFQCYLKGATLILNQAQRSMPRLARACRQLAHELGFRVWSNIYITPPDSSGFSPHRDDHEVLVLQVSGTKLWTVHPNADEAVELQLEPGDLLYLPRATTHSARAGELASIHITFGMSPVYVFDLIEELALVAKEHPAFQQIAPASDRGEPSLDEFEGRLAAEIATLLRETGMARLSENRLQRLAKSQDETYSGRFADITSIGNITPQTLVGLRPGLAFTLREREGSIQVLVGERSVSVPAFLKVCLDRITTEGRFAVEELQGLISGEGKVELVRSFVRAGLLEILAISAPPGAK